MRIRQTPESLATFYEGYRERVAAARKKFGSLTLAQKLLYAHMPQLADENGDELVPGVSFIDTTPDHVAMQDATAQMAVLQLSQLDRPARVPTSVHLDHLVQARDGMALDLPRAVEANRVPYEFLQSAAARYGFDFWSAGSGIIHQIVAEQYAFPGGMLIGTDSHTVNAGGMTMLAIGVGGGDAVDVMAGMPFNLLMPKLIGVKLTGRLSGWTRPKDVIIELVRRLTTSGGTNSIVEFFGSGCHHISATGRMTIANMGAEHGATASVFPADANTLRYLDATGRKAWTIAVSSSFEELMADPDVLADPKRFFDQVIEIDLSALEPEISGPHSPDRVRRVSEMVAEKHDVPLLSNALVGSCTNSSSGDIARAASLVKAATAAGLRPRVPLGINCGSQSILDTIRADGTLATLEAAGATIFANACGGCIGMWKRKDSAADGANAIISSFNRNFAGRNDGSTKTLSYLASPELVVAYAYAGTLNWNPLKDNVPDTNFRFPLPVGSELPTDGLRMSEQGYIAPPEELMKVPLAIPEGSDRLARLEPFPKPLSTSFVALPILVVAKGKCTTDHISAGGEWLQYRGNIAQISRNTYMRVVNPWTGKANDARNVFTNERGTYYDVALDYQQRGIGWAVVGDNNFGEGSSREHAALQPRYLGCKVIVVRGNFARIHETNLKKQGIMPLRFANPDDYDLIVEGARLSVMGDLAPGKPLRGIIHPNGAEIQQIELVHSLSKTQIEWFKAGSCLNYAYAQQ